MACDGTESQRTLGGVFEHGIIKACIGLPLICAPASYSVQSFAGGCGTGGESKAPAGQISMLPRIGRRTSNLHTMKELAGLMHARLNRLAVVAENTPENHEEGKLNGATSLSLPKSFDRASPMEASIVPVAIVAASVV